MRALSLIALLVAGSCTEMGPVVVRGPDPAHPHDNSAFPGLANILADAPSHGSLNIFVIHGMRAESDQYEPDLLANIAARLHLVPSGAPSQQVLLAERPTVTLNGKDLWKGRDAKYWSAACAGGSQNLQGCDAPYLDISPYTAPDDKEVVFYSLNYWGTLVWLKCSQLVAPDTLLTGDFPFGSLGNADYCNSRFGAAAGILNGANPVSSPAVLLDQAIKNTIMVWGFGDAAIVMSGYERVLRDVVRQGMEAEKQDVVRRILKREDKDQELAAKSDCLNGIFGSPDKQRSQRYAAISESLGSYVLLDTLGHAATSELAPSPPLASAPTDPEAGCTDRPNRPSPKAAQTRGVQEISGLSILCRVSQVHMLANQISLLRFSQIRSTMPREGNGKAPEADDAPIKAHCPIGPSQRFVVAYHDPSDLLTFYVPPPGQRLAHEEQLDADTINVVVPFAPVIVSGVLANPVDAHSPGQEKDGRIQDMVSYGSDGMSPNDRLVPMPQ